MLIKQAPDVRSSEITPRSLYLRRREFIQASTAALVGAAVASLPDIAGAQGGGRTKLPNVRKSAFSTTEKANSYDEVTGYNNFYEFGTGKEDPKANASSLRTRPWTVRIDGEVARPASYGIEDFVKPFALEERIYRMRCVEAWSIVVPWIGIPLKDVLAHAQPTSKAKYVRFTTLYNPVQMPYQKSDVLAWPYVEGLRLDEAMHPLAILAVGLYGEVLPNQNGAPLRLIVPWKYGFKGIKSIVKITLTESQPRNTWQAMASNEYGFYANVNPGVDHPRWSQATERRLGEFRRRPTLMFNGYEEVASLYSGMDLHKNF